MNSSSNVPLTVAEPPSRIEASGAASTRGGSVWTWWAIAATTALGLLGMAPQLISLWAIWTGDPLRSIGMLLAPASLLLTLRVWRQRGWELKGTWWGMLPILLAFLLVAFSRNLVLSLGTGAQTVNFLPHVLPIYLYGSGVVLLFAGVGVWRSAWFPLALLLCLQPVPEIFVHTFDLPLQSFAAQTARSFAGLIRFSPNSNAELLRLMFTPDFGMFIAPGCDGMRGAITLGYLALIVGYLKRVSFVRWAIYVVGAVLLGHVFNLIRLCTLVLYYRVAAGHEALESVAKNADYVIGGCLFFGASLLFLWIALRKPKNAGEQEPEQAAPAVSGGRISVWKVAAFAAVALAAAVPGLRAVEYNRDSLLAAVSSDKLSPAELDKRVPAQLGAYKLQRTWQEQNGGLTVLENAAYSSDPSQEIVLGVWLKPTGHNVHESWMTHGDVAEMRAVRSFSTASGTVGFDTAFYSDGITDSIAGNVYCTPSYCVAAPEENRGGIRAGFSLANDFTTRGVRLVPIYFRMESPHANGAKDAAYQKLEEQARAFLAGVDLKQLSRSFQ